MNFGGETLKEGIEQMANNHTSFAPLRLCVNPTAQEPPAHA
jgi:hypothetical protein